jgi:hypothetical protein
MKYQIFFLFLLVATSCNQTSNIDPKGLFAEEIKKLTSDKMKSDYLYDLWHEDQHFRKGEEGDIISKHGYDSKEHKAFKVKWKTHDNAVFNKMKLYLQIYGYPNDISQYHELAINAFPIIIGHNHNYKAQRELLPYLYKAYKEGSCPLGDLVWVLGEMHESKHRGKRYEMKSNRFTVEDEFEELNDVLNLNLVL